MRQNSFYPLSRLQWGFQTIHLLTEYCVCAVGSLHQGERWLSGSLKEVKKILRVFCGKRSEIQLLKVDVIAIRAYQGKDGCPSLSWLRAGGAGSSAGVSGRGVAGPPLPCTSAPTGVGMGMKAPCF